MYPQSIVDVPVKSIVLGSSGIKSSPYQPYQSPINVPTKQHESKIPQYQQRSPQQVQPQQLATPLPQKPEIIELYHVEREMQVLSVEDVKEPWKKKRVNQKLRFMALYKNQSYELKVTSNEVFQVRELEARIKIMKERY